MKPLIIIVEDEKPIRHFIKVALETQNYGCIEAQSGREALSLTASHHPDIMVLDLGLPDIDGLDVIKQVRQWSGIAIVVVSARGREREKVEALDAGADDYLTKPFGVAELLARIRVSLRRVSTVSIQSGMESFVFQSGDLKVNFEKRRVELNGEDIHLTPTEYSLLTLLAKHQGKVLTHRFIMNKIWGPSDDTQSLRVCMANLRRKIEKDPAQPRYITTEVGVGYRMMEE
jgi:two-component system KDP operon response regulator KdpE